MELDEYVKYVVIGAIGGLVTTLLLEVKGMDFTSVGYYVKSAVILVLIFVVCYIGWRIIKKVEIDKKDPLVVAQETNHSVGAVDRYIKDFKRVRLCYQEGKDTEFISLATGLNKTVVNEYLKIIENSIS